MVTPRFDEIERVLVISEDVLGPMQNGLYVELVNGTWMTADKRSEIRRIVIEIARIRPEIALAIEQRLAIIPGFPCEQSFDVNPDQ
jgi:hypothetical protein